MEKYDIDTCSTITWEAEETIQLGGNSNSEPISLKLVCISSAFEDIYWSSFDEYVANGTCRAGDIDDLPSKYINIADALRAYPALKTALAATGEIQLSIKLQFLYYKCQQTCYLHCVFDNNNYSAFSIKICSDM